MFITFQDLGVFIVFSIVIVLGVFLSIVSYNVIKLLKSINKVIGDNHENITKTLNTLPETVKNINETTLSLKENIDKAASTVDSIENVVSETIATVGDNTESVLSIVTIIGKIVKTILDIFSSRRRS
jgi:ABC-type transporter Mla subunit MlaD